MIDRHVVSLAYHPERTAQASKPVKVRLDGVKHMGHPLEASHDGKNWFPVGTLSSVKALDLELVKMSETDTIDATAAPLPVKIQAAHEQAQRQSAMVEACAIASEFGRISREGDDPEPLAALMRMVSTQEHATLQLLKLVGRIGLREWFNNDFVVLSKDDATKVDEHLRFNDLYSRELADAIEKADQ